MKLSIITLALRERREMREKLCAEIQKQVAGNPEIEHLIFEDSGGIPYGQKMGRAFREAQGEYVCVVDDDDQISPNYISLIWAALEKDPDVVTFRMFRPDKNEFWGFQAGIAQDGEVWTAHLALDGGRSISGPMRVMMANHLCIWRRSFALLSPWLPLRYAPDVFWYRLLNAAAPAGGYRQIHIPHILYYYCYQAEQTRCQRPLDCALTVDRCAGGISGWRVRDTGELVISAFGKFNQPIDREVVQIADGAIRTFERGDLEHLYFTDLK